MSAGRDGVRARPTPYARLSALAFALPFLPWLLLHGAGLWVRPHYQFFPLVLLGAGCLAYRGLQIPGPVGAPSRSGPILLGVSGLLLVAALLLFSPWAGAVAALIAVAGAVLAVGGSALAYRLAPAWVFLWLAIPPPGGLDGQLILGLKRLTVACSSRALDLIGVVHLLSGNIIEAPGKRLLVEEACSGVHSLFAVLSGTLFLILWTRTPVVRSLLLLAAAVGWVIAANIVRVTLIAYLYTRWNLDVSEGWRHELLGWFIVAGTVGLIVSTARLFLFFARQAPTAAEPGAGPEAIAPPSPRRPVWPPLAFGVFGVVELAVLTPYFAEYLTTLSPRPIVQAMDALDADALPLKAGPWERVGFETKHRSIDDNNFGDVSRIWVYRAGTLTALVSVDYPFPGWHDLTICYRNIGWELAKRGPMPAVPADDIGAGLCVEAEFDKPLGEHSHLLFGLVDAQGRFATPPPEQTAALGLGDRLGRRLADPLNRWQRFLGQTEGARPDEPLYQVQVYVESGAPLTEAERAAVVALFGQASRTFRQAAPRAGEVRP
jgi:exosortase